MLSGTQILEVGEVARVTGPARIEVDEGRILLVGSEFSRGSALVVHELRSYSLKALERTRLRVFLGAGGVFEKASLSEEVIDDWINVAEIIMKDVEGGERLRVVIMGPPESGKTTLSAFIVNYLRDRGVKSCLVEGDVGQEDLAMPATVAMTIVERPFIWQRELSFQEFRFVGCISPRNCELGVISALMDLTSSALSRGCRAVVVNTDGWVSGDGVNYKIELIKWVRPTHIVSLNPKLSSLMTLAFRGLVKVLNAKSPVTVRTRSREERQRLRSEAYRRYFINSSVRTVRASEVGLIRVQPFNCEQASMNELLSTHPELISVASSVLRACYNEKELVLLTEGSLNAGLLEALRNEVYAKHSVKLVILRREDLTGCLMGIIGEGFRDVGVGMVEDFKLGEAGDVLIKLRTPYGGPIIALVGSNIRLDEEYREIRRGEWFVGFKRDRS